MDMVRLSETRRTGSGKPLTRALPITGHHVKGVAIGVSSRLLPSVVEVTPVDERIIRLRLKHSLCFMYVVAVYAPTEVCETEEEMLYSKLDSVLDQCPNLDALIVLGDFNAVIGTERASWFWCQK